MSKKWSMVRRHCANDKELRFWQRYATRMGVRSPNVAFYAPVTDRVGTIGGLCIFGNDIPRPSVDWRLVARFERRITRLRAKWGKPNAGS